MTHKPKARRDVVDAPILNPFGSSQLRQPPFKLGQLILNFKRRNALRESYTPATAMREYRDFAERTYQGARKYIPGSSGKAPRIDFADPAGALHALTDFHAGHPSVVPPRHRGVHFTPADAWAYVLDAPSEPGGEFARFAPVHEFAHVYQRGKDVKRYPYGGSRARVEGGAQAFAQQVAPALGLPVQGRASNRQYADFADFVRATKGAGYVFRGQFGGGLRGVLRKERDRQRGQGRQKRGRR